MGGSGRSRSYFFPIILEEEFAGVIFMPTMISYKTNGDLIEGGEYSQIPLWHIL